LRRALLPGEHPVRPRVRSSLSRRPSLRAALGAAFALLPAAASADSAARVPRGNPTLVLQTPAGERTLPAVDLSFVYYERVYYQRPAPRSEEARGTRTDVVDRRHECKCVRLEDWSKIRFSKIRQIEIAYPENRSVAEIRVTDFEGKLLPLRADSLYGAVDSFAPR